MSIAESCAAVIPCLNEGRTIATLVRTIRSQVPAVIVVDDGSADDTARQAASAGATVLSHEQPCGKGAALNKGWSYAHQLGCRWAITLDGDGQHLPQDIAAFFAKAAESNARMIVGNRMAQLDTMPLLRRYVNRWMSRRLSAYSGCSLPDSQCGFRLIHLPSWSRLEFTSEHFEIESELLIRFLHAGFSIDFVPIQTRYAGERSKIRPFRDTLRWFRWWSEIRRELAVQDRTDLPEVADFSAASLK